MPIANDTGTEGDLAALNANPATPPQARLLWSAVVDVGPREDLGAATDGHRFRVPILGGRFYGGPQTPALTGHVPAKGADMQLLRPDGIKELDAEYEMIAEDGTRLSIRNRVIVDEARRPQRYAMSVLKVHAPDGPHAWLNRRLLAGTLQTLRPERAAVIVRAWELDLVP